MNRPLLLAALAAASLLHARAALAGRSCGGGGSDSGSDSGGGSSGGSDSGSDSGSSWSDSDSSSDSSSSSPPTPACVDATDIVGHRQCTPFGTWASVRSPVVFFELGTAMRTFASPLGEATGHVSHEAESFAYRVVAQPAEMASPPPETSLVTTLRVGFAPARGVYLAGELEIGGLVRTAGRVEMMTAGTFGAPAITPTQTLVVGGLGVAGVRGEVLGVALGAELAGGGQSITHQYESRYLSCVNTTSVSTGGPILEARARASIWASPFVNIGASVGSSVLDRGGWMAGLHLGLSSRAFGDLRD